MKILIIGCGSIGSRHARNLKKLRIKDIVLCDKDYSRLTTLGKSISSKFLYTDYKKAVAEHPDISAALICTPTSYHIDQVIFLAKQKIHLFIEKPLSNNLKNTKILSRLVTGNKLTVMMGHAFMFDYGYQKLKSLLKEKTIGKVYFVTYLHGQYLPDWHPTIDYRIEYTARKELGGGALLTLGSHTFYLMEWLFGKVEVIQGSLIGQFGKLDVNVDDSALFIMKTNKNIIIQSQNNFISKIYQHKMIIEGESGSMEYDFTKKKIKILLPNNKSKLINVKEDNNDRYLREMKYFITHISKKQLDENLDLNSGLRFLDMIKNLGSKNF